jgi:hypothetical protein
MFFTVQAHAAKKVTGYIRANPEIVNVEEGKEGYTVVSWRASGGKPIITLTKDSETEKTLWLSPSSLGVVFPVQANSTYLFKFYDSKSKKYMLSTLTVKGVLAAPTPKPTPVPGCDYQVGVDYHATGADFNATGFLSRYHVPAVRSLVQSQLKAMADKGASIISTRVWLVTTRPATTPAHWTFPPTPTELSNLRAYAQDVAADGRLTLDLTILRLWAAEFRQGSPTTTLGHEKLKPADYSSRFIASYKSIIDAVHDVKRADGSRVVETVYMDGETMVGAKKNQEWFLKTFYPGFHAYASEKGLTPSLYFLIEGKEEDIMQPGFVFSKYPILNGHRSMFWPYLSLRFMQDNGLPLPKRMDFSNYVRKNKASYEFIVQKIFDDADAVMPSLGITQYGNAETWYLSDPTERKALGAAMSAQSRINCRLQRTTFWTTPNGGGDGIHQAFPFVIEDYLP